MPVEPNIRPAGTRSRISTGTYSGGHYVLFFTAAEAGPARWVGVHPGTFLLSLADAFELGRRFNALRLGPALGAGEGGG